MQSGVPHPPIMFIEPQAYDYFVKAMRVINRRMGISQPQDGLYTFKGIKLRRSSHG